MRYLIVSDTHGRHATFDLALSEVGEIDGLFHLGDVEGGEDYIESACKCPLYIVGGNNDFFSGMPYEKTIKVEGKTIFMTHGHGQWVHMGTARLLEEGKKYGADIIMFGHTHKPYQAIEDGILVINPGSLSLPRQEGHKPSYAILEIDGNGKLEVEMRYLP